jgi:hypothetical protein
MATKKKKRKRSSSAFAVGRANVDTSLHFPSETAFVPDLPRALLVPHPLGGKKAIHDIYTP